MAQPQEFPFDIMDVAELLHLHIRRRQADSVYADCPICGDKRGKMNINFAKNLWRCNYCNEGGGMLALYGKVYGISNSEAYREICDTLQNGLTAPEYTVKELPEKAAVEQSALASPQEKNCTVENLWSTQRRSLVVTRAGVRADTGCQCFFLPKRRWSSLK